MKAYNIMEDIVKKYLNDMFAMRFDVCKCDICKEDIVAYVLSRVPPKYVTSDSGAMRTLIDQTKVEQSSVILKELVKAMELVAEKPRHEVEKEQTEEAYQLLMQQIKLDRGADFSHYRDRLLKRRIALRMRACNVNSYSEYLQVLVHRPQEYEKLFEVMTINVSSFFRDAHVWAKLNESIFPEIIARKKEYPGQKIRIWSAGCSHGEEPYTLAISFYLLLELEKPAPGLEIVATDIDKECLQLAKAAKYSKECIKTLSPYLQKRFFIPIEDKYQVVPHVKDFVRVQEKNLIHDPSVSDADMVLCRNVFIYFNRSLQEHLIMKFYEALSVGGYFVLGTSENLLGEARDLFETVDGECRIYRKIKLKR
ncbi:MAG: late competence development ComFB family protein [Candidatus Omnitrophica bacterium]|nr:late competence development ComFB family protein [Candidatus Omnitrophota bacterium]